MAGLRSGLLLYLMPCLVQFTDQFVLQKNCGTVIKKCGTRADIQCSADNSITDVRVGPINRSTCKGDTFLNTTHPTSQDGRLHLTCSGNTANLRIDHVQHSDAGTYWFFLKSEDTSGYMYHAELQIEGSSEIPQICVKWMQMKIECQVTGGCPVGTIQWADGSGTNWTQSAISEEKDGVFTSTLLLQKSSIMAEYCCTVTYWNKPDNQTRCISKAEETQCKGKPSPISERSVDSEKPNNAFFLVAVPVLICAFLALWIYRQRRCAHKDREIKSSEAARLH